MGLFRKSSYKHLMVGAAVGALTLGANAAWAQTKPITIQPQALASALHDFGAQTGRQIMFTPESAASKMSRGVNGATDEEVALAQLLDGTGLTFRREANIFLITGASDPQSGSAAGDGADQGTVQALVVTAQKREENIQDVPIAMSAFTQEDLTRSQVAGGPDLITQVPNMTFTKTNFSSYSIQIRGIGTQAISATTDAAVAVAFNNTPFIRNRFFEQEFYDLQRVEVLRGPQGTLYGRNATAGVVNILSAKPKFTYEAKLAADVANYKSTRLEGMLNIPLVENKVALRIAGAWTKRDGYDTNQITGNQIDGRDLWSTRLSLRIAPSDRLEANLIWEHFEENDDRLRSGKQLCHTDEVTSVGGIPTTHYQLLPDSVGNQVLFAGVQATFSQGCSAASLYSPDSFQTPNGISLPYYIPLGVIFLPTALDDPYISRTQSHDLRTIESTVDPQYRAKSDLAEVQLQLDLGRDLTLTSETGYNADTLFSFEDYNRFNTAAGAWRQPTPNFPTRAGVLSEGEFGGVFCDPQIGCTDRLVAVDLSTAKSRQFSQELRLSSDYDGRFNFSLGANFLRYDTEDKYYVFVNSLTLYSAIDPYKTPGAMPPYVGGLSDNHECLPNGAQAPDFSEAQTVVGCVYIDPNPIRSLNDQGHNYFLSRNPYKLISYAAFGEAYYNITDSLKLTGGLRWTVDKKEAPRIPSWILASKTVGYPVIETVRQEWREPTGRLAIDWRPDLSFTDQTLLYASYGHGYKAGGANPPPAGIVCYSCTQEIVEQSATHPKTFDAEFINAVEVGAKNTFLDGRIIVNADAFYYDYTGYQISQIVDRSAVNLNFDATVWGLELEADWRPIENLRLGFKGGYENTRVGDGMKAIDLMDRTAGDPNWILVRPFPTFPSNCILPMDLFVSTEADPRPVNVGGKSGGNAGACEIAYLQGLDPVTDAPYVDLTQVQGPVVQGPLSTLSYHPGYAGWDPATAPNHGEGIDKDLSGNELPNAPHFTATITADYTLPLPHDWLATLHTDLYYQSEAWTRIFNTPGYDKLKAYTNVNLAAIFTNEDAGWKIMAYIKNVFDRDSITGAFLNSDDSGLTTNVFLTEPRLYGLRVTKDWTGLPIWGGFSQGESRRTPGAPYPLTIEIGGEASRFDAPYAAFSPFSNEFPDSLDTVAGLENRELDRGDARQVRLTWRPGGESWAVSAGVRYGKTNVGTGRAHAQEIGDVGCNVAEDFGFVCAPDYAGGRYYDLFHTTGINVSDTSATSREKYTIADFMVGMDVGLGVAGVVKSTVGAGLRFVHFESATQLTMNGVPDWQIPDYDVGFYNPVSLHRIDATFTAQREFKGAGPVLSWDAASRLLGDEEAGHVDFDWSITGGVLFGDQKTSLHGQQTETYYHGLVDSGPPREGDPVVSSLGPPSRAKSVTVPLLDLSLGLSYEIQRIKVSTGYRWERYYNVIDAGYAEHKSSDRTIDGPYFKIAVGFGG